MGRIAGSLRQGRFDSNQMTKDIPYTEFQFLFDILVIVLAGLTEVSDGIVDNNEDFLSMAKQWSQRLDLLPLVLHELVLDPGLVQLAVTFPDWLLELLKSEANAIPIQYKDCIKKSACALKKIDTYKEAHVWGQLVLYA